MEMPLDQLISLKAVAGAFLYSAIGLIVFLVGFIVIDKATPGDMWKEIIEERNVAFAIVVGAVAIGISMIISGAIHG